MIKRKGVFFKTLVNITKKPIMTFLFGAVLALLLVSIIPNLVNAVNAVMNIPNENTTIRITAQPDQRIKPTPQDYLKENQIKVYKDRVVIESQNIKWASFEDTNSMLPILDSKTNALQIEPKCPEEVNEGDIISYKSEYSTGIIIHRIVFKGQDDDGTYFILKGDNNPSSDPGKIRCSQIQRRVIGILY